MWVIPNIVHLIVGCRHDFSYTFWPNNSSRMYVMEGTGEWTTSQSSPLLAVYRAPDDRLVSPLPLLKACRFFVYQCCRFILDRHKSSWLPLDVNVKFLHC